MAGIHITVGTDIQVAYENGRDYFLNVRNLDASSEIIDKGYSLSKFTRCGCDDLNYASNENIRLWVVGTLLYKNKIGNAALEELIADLPTSPIEILIDHCDGPFCMVLHYHPEHVLWVVTDHAGIINMYSYQSGSTCVVSSSSCALSRNNPVSLNHSAIAQFLRTGNVYGSDTIYSEIKVLEPASIYKIDPDSKEPLSLIKRYWKSPIEIYEEASLNDSRDALIKALVESFEVLSKENLICDFTAGFDSRLNMAVLSQFRPFSDISAFVFGPHGSKEVGLVKGYCKVMDIPYHHLCLPDDWEEKIIEYTQHALPVTDGEENIFSYAPILYAQEYKARYYSYSLNGLGGELYRDFWWIQEIYSSRRPAHINRLIDTRILQYEYDYSIFSGNWITLMHDVKSSLKAAFEASLADMNLCTTYNTLQIDNLYYRQKIRRWAGRTMSSSNQYINTIAPLTFKKCLDAVLPIPARHKRNGKLVKSIIEKLSPPLAELKMLSGVPCKNIRVGNAHKYIPILIDYGKRGFRKIVQKIMNRTVLIDTSMNYQPSLFFTYLFHNRDFVKKHSYDSLITRDLYDRDKYLDFYHRAMEGDFHYFNQLGNMLTLEERIRHDMKNGQLCKQ